jgi:hypothetical protein
MAPFLICTMPQLEYVGIASAYLPAHHNPHEKRSSNKVQQQYKDKAKQHHGSLGLPSALVNFSEPPHRHKPEPTQTLLYRTTSRNTLK